MTVATSIRTHAVAELAKLAEIRGAVPRAFVNTLAADCNVHPSTLYRWWTDDAPGGIDNRLSHIRALDPEHIEVVFAHFGNLTQAKDSLNKTHPEIAAMSDATFRRRWDDVDPAIRAMASDGAEGLMASQLRVLYEASHRNDLWHTDHQELPIWTIPKGTQTPLKPWLTTVQDDHTRRIMSVVLTMERPTTESTLVAIADGVRAKAIGAGQWAGGLPTVLHSDNGGEFRSALFAAALMSLGIEHKRTFPYMKHQNGKVERVQRTMQQGLIATLPGYSQGPTTLTRVDIFGSKANLIGEEALAVRIYDWVDHYNQVRPHSSLGGRTPNAVWVSQQNPLRQADPHAVRLAMLASPRPTYKVQQTGVYFGDQYYTAPELASWVTRKVQVRYMPSDASFVEVFDGDDWICTAVPHQALTPEQLEGLREKTKQQYTDAKAYALAAAREREIRAELTPDPAESEQKPQTKRSRTATPPDRASTVSASDNALLDLLGEGDAS